MFQSRRVVDCPSCGAGEADIKQISGRNVCTACGLVLPGGSSVYDQVAYSEKDNYSDRDHPRKPKNARALIDILEEIHPGCVNSAIGVVNASKDPNILKGVPTSEHDRLAQALAYVAYRMDGQPANIADLASQVCVPVERLRKDINRLSSKLGIDSVSPTTLRDIQDDEDELDASGDVAEFKRALIGVVKPWASLAVANAARVRDINAWCSNLFRAAMAAGDVQVTNSPPRCAAEAALAIYCKMPGNALGWTMKRPRDAGDDPMRKFVSSLTKHATSRRVASCLHKHVTAKSATP